MLAEKELFINEIKNKVDPQGGFVLVAYKNMPANLAADFRNQIVHVGGDFFVLKKRVLMKVAQDMGLTYELSELEGHVGLLMAKGNLIATTKALFAFKDANKESIQVLGGYFEGKKCSSSQVEHIATLPSLEVMRSQVLGLFEAPMSQTLAVFEAILTSIIYCVDNKSKNES